MAIRDCIKCPNCGGDGWTGWTGHRTKCSRCEGYGTLAKGYMTCWVCNGSGTYRSDNTDETCWKCKGAGMYEYEGYKACSCTPEKKGCFISTTICTHLGKGEQCDELVFLRKFRDEHLLTTNQGVAMVAEYYSISPPLLEKLEKIYLQNSTIYQFLYEEYLSVIILNLQHTKFEDAISNYKKMLEYITSL
ncbi:MAG: hypothetical protein RL368_956 [Pseudomonadota bacterium]